MNTEEGFILASLKEFVKIWGSGNQATFNLECRNSQVLVKFETHLGHPAHQHFVPHPPQGQDHQHGMWYNKACYYTPVVFTTGYLKKVSLTNISDYSEATRISFL